MLLTLAVAVGATAAVFAVTEAVLLRSLPYLNPDRLVVLHDEYLGLDATGLGLSGPEFFDYVEMTRELESLAAYRTGQVTLILDDPERIGAAWLSAGMRELLGVEPIVGRGFTAGETRVGGRQAALVSHRFWRQRLASEQNLRSAPVLSINDALYRVVGVLPEDFRLPSDLRGPESTDLYLPLRLDPANPGHRQNAVLSVIGRLAPGSTVAGARREVERIAESFRESHPSFYPDRFGFQMTLQPIVEEVVGNVRRVLLAVGGAVGLLFMVALANVTGLILARVGEQQRELGIRFALGAGMRDLWRQFASDSFVLTLLAIVPGVILAYLICRVLLVVHADSIPRLDELRLDYWGFLFAASAATLVVLVLAVSPLIRVVRARAPHGGLFQTGLPNAFGIRPGTGRRLLVVGQLTLTLALTVGAAFLITSYRNLRGVDVGFEPEDVLVVHLSLPSSQYDTPTTVTSFFQEMLTRVRSSPATETAGLVTFLPLDQPSEVWPIEVRDAGVEDEPSTGVAAQIVSEGYFEALRIPVVSGRDFAVSDALGEPVAVVNRAFVRRFLAPGSSLGRAIRPRLSAEAPWASIVGVVGDVRHEALQDEPRPRVYFYYQQIPRFAGVAVRSMNVALRPVIDPALSIAPTREAIWSLDESLPLGSVRTLDEVVAQSISRPRFTMQLLGMFAIVALLVSLSGIYGLISHLVAGSRRELGIRAALGATPRGIVRYVLRTGLVLTGIAVGLGIAIGAALVQVFDHLLYELHTWTLWIYLEVALAVIAASALASYLPARRAASIDPSLAMREE